MRPRGFVALLVLVFFAARGFVVLLALVFFAAQSPLPGFPPGLFTNRAALSGGGSSYIGPGDVVSLTEFWGLRCYNAAYAGNVAEIKSPGDTLTTTITCAAGGVLGSTGTAIATTCSVSCTVKTLYAQTGSGHDMANPTEASRPAYTLSCATISKPCMTLSGTKGLFNTVIGSLAQIYSVTAVAQRTAVAAASCVLCTASANVDLYFSASGQASIFWGSAAMNSGAAENTWHSLNAIGNGASSTLTVDANAPATTPNPGTTSMSGDYTIGAGTSGVITNQLTGLVAEVGIKSGDFTSNIANLASNQKLYWGY